MSNPTELPDERAEFESAQRKYHWPLAEADLRQDKIGNYYNHVTQANWSMWSARAALARRAQPEGEAPQAALSSRPAEVDDDPPQWWHELQAAAEALDDAGAPLNAESVRKIAEQYRQGQRDAVAADRARRGVDEELLDAAEAILEVLDSYPGRLVPINRMSATVTRLRESVAQEQFKLERGSD